MLSSLEEIISHFRASGKSHLVLFGPTATGKSALGVQLAEALGGEVINADARQIYRGMPIGTGAPTAEEMKGIPHHLFLDHSPAQGYDAMKYKREAQARAELVVGRGKVPIFVGGTGLYIEALLGMITFDIPSDLKIRTDLEREWQERGTQGMYQELLQVDPESATSIEPNNARYILRALEIFRSTGRPKSSLARAKKLRRDFAVYGLVWERELLVDRINTRHARMFDQGFCEEVAQLMEQEVLPEVWKTIGYPEVRAYLEGNMTREEAIERTQAAARQYAKRQMTWLRRMKQRYPMTLLDGGAIHQTA